MKICILTAGKGSRMNSIQKNINKALLPINGKPIISHIIESFSIEDEFVIGLGHLGKQVKDFLSSAYPKKVFHFVDIDNFDGYGSGPGYSLLCCKEKLQEPFHFLPCDMLFEHNFNDAPIGNWIGTNVVSSKESENFCNILIKNKEVVEIKDKQSCSNEYSTFTGFLHIEDYTQFWKSLENDVTLINGEHQISNGLQGLLKTSGLFAVDMEWNDMGNLINYQNAKKNESNYNFEKSDEFIFFVNNKIIKFFADPRNVTNRVKRSKLKQNVFPTVQHDNENFFSYTLFEGETFYSCGTPELFKQLLQWLDNNLWIEKNVDKKILIKSCHEFYYEKSIKRLKSFQNLNPNYIFPKKINGVTVIPIPELFKKINWNMLYGGISSFIHGDLQFDNIIYNKKSNKFILIDWRQDFAGEIEFGDLYYDIAKLYGGILLNYDYIKKGLFKVDQEGDEISIDFKVRDNSSEYIKILEKFIESNKMNKKIVLCLVGLIYINMAPLHHKPFNFLLIGLGTKILNDVISFQE
jgi:NDP-sugar pyrophosphorylase family protein